MISKSTKQQIIQTAQAYMTKHGLSQDKFTAHVKKMNGGQGVSVAYLNDLLKGSFATGQKDTMIDDKYFLRIAKSINVTVRKSYRQHHSTDNFIACMNAFGDARDSGMPNAIDGSTGSGKSYVAEIYLQQHPKNTYIVRCDGDLTAKSFFMEMAHSLGMSFDGPVYTIRKNVIQKLRNEENPLLIIDEAENLKDRAWDSLKRIMDDLRGYCGMTFIGANEFQKQLEKKASKLKGCFPQVLRRLREGEFVKLFALSQDDVADVAKKYGITKVAHIKALFDTCKNMGELTAMLERVMRENDDQGIPLDELIDLHCNVQRKLRAVA